MKKTINLFVILGMVFVASSVRAEDTEKCPSPYVYQDGRCLLKPNNFGGTSVPIPTLFGDRQKDGREARLNELKTKEGAIKTAIEDQRELAKTKMEALKESIKNEKDAVKAKIKEGRIIGRENALHRFDTAIERVSALKDKINALITKFEAKEVNVTGAKVFVLTAELKLNNAKLKVIEVNTLLSVSAEKLSDEKKIKLQALAQEIQTLIKEAHRALNDATKSLRDAIKATREATTTTPSTNTATETTENTSQAETNNQ